MANDIQGLLSKKMTENDVAALLGEPSAQFTKQEYQYSLGMCSGLGIDYDYLHIYFDEQGNFSQAKITQH
ncbi:MAG: outer membrane protein assembly factor BamE [Gammaproteobacteria bacterium]|nr:outer membrane protein assembly factor BamE [Gammaproteobacteria bacterium]MBU2058003.1 outer membrane protein assembly factor BamE [Gammaproteobacteria bacterium]MBU2174355.1 outer membrane protein assembly factor BamE [Gammaproteobacteria bacterium]MBU2247581.1 outer membrane protein assembly factor BamE [Gammaproteobacteria bacterium]MBU2346086.1 outer membrane protein assembly factor BamE [Gammaproteobacteria bacterium]